MFFIIAFLAGACVCFAVDGDVGSVDCVHSVWSEWKLGEGDLFEFRTRKVLQHPKNDGRPCGRLVQFRTSDDEPDDVSPEDKFLSRFLAGNRPSYNILDDNSKTSYTLSRDILVMLDTTILPSHFTYYIDMVVSLVGKICGRIGTNLEDNRIALATFDSRVSVINDFSYGQSRLSLQDEILGVSSSDNQPSDLFSALSFARTAIINETFGSRGYIISTKEVLIVTSYSESCTTEVIEMTRRLQTVSVVYVIVVGEGVTSSRPADLCLKDLVASYPPELHFLQLENNTRLSHVSKILLDQPLDGNKFC